MALIFVATAGLVLSLSWRENGAKLGCAAFFAVLLVVLALVGVR